VKPPIEIRGLDTLQRLASLGAMDGLAPALRAEAEAVAVDARQRLKEGGGRDRLAASVEVTAAAGGSQPSFAVGTAAPAGFYLEFGTAKMRARPWLVPILHARLLEINHTVRKVFSAALKARAQA
jgi:hypothetical protein